MSITDGSCIDVYEMDAASESGVEEVRETIVGVVEYRPAICRFKVFIIDEVHDLSPKAFDALLKTIEEPPAHIIFVLATTEYNKVPPTIRSRCQKFEFHRGSVSELLERLQHVAKSEGVEAEPAALSAIARMADGGFRDALTLLEQAIITSDGKITLESVYDQLGLVTEDVTDKILLAVKEGNIPELMTLTSELMRLGRDPRALLDSLLYRLADLTRVLYGVEMVNTGDTARQASAHDIAARLGQEDLLSMRASLTEAHKVIRDITLPRLWLESEMIRISGVIRNKGSIAAIARPADVEKAVPRERKEPDFERATPRDRRETTSATAATNGGHKTERVAVADVSAAQPGANTPGEQSATVPVPDPSLDPALNKAHSIWHSFISDQTDLPGNAPITLRLQNTKVLSFADNVLTVQLARKMDVEWMLDKPQRMSHVLKNLEKRGVPEWQVKFVAGEASSKHHEPVAVELPAEGQKLAQMAREVFGS